MAFADFVKFAKLNTFKIFFEVAIVKIITREKNLKKPKLCDFFALGRHRKKSNKKKADLEAHCNIYFAIFSRVKTRRTKNNIS